VSGIVGAIFARGGSKGVPRKNIRQLAGRPLIAHAIETAKRARTLERLIVSTDDEEIASVARQYGAEVPFMRPAALAQDDSPEWLAWRHALQTLEEQDGHVPDVLVAIPTTSPLRAPGDIDACVDRLLESDADIVITVTHAARSPYFNMVVLDGDAARLVIPPSEEITRRQDAPVVYDMTTVAYAARSAFVLKAGGLFEGTTRAVIIPTERALDIDDEHSFRIAERLLSDVAR
jgi:N-acylneuraminate cytidylyltransferase